MADPVTHCIVHPDRPRIGKCMMVVHPDDIEAFYGKSHILYGYCKECFDRVATSGDADFFEDAVKKTLREKVLN